MKKNLLNNRRLISVIALIVLITLLIQIQFSAAVTTSTVTFDFDTSDPMLVEGQSTPFAQSSGGLTASISSPSNPAAFSIQSYSTTFIKLEQFSGKYLYDNNPTRDILDIKFDNPIFGVNFTFATVELHGGANAQPSNLDLIAYANTTLVGSTSASGSFTTSSYPQGTLSFISAEPFDWIRISLPSQSSGATDFFVDNLVVTIVSPSSSSLTQDSSQSPSISTDSSSSSTPNTLEFGTLILVPIILAVAILAVFLIRRHHAKI